MAKHEGQVGSEKVCWTTVDIINETLSPRREMMLRRLSHRSIACYRTFLTTKPSCMNELEHTDV